MVDKEMSLTFSLRNNSGVYALLLGSGVSTEAGVPTGWGIIENLIRQMADVQDEDPDPDPFEWYEAKYDQEPEYDELIEEVAPSKEERQSLLEGYFEPTEEEREEGIKTPSKAHESIAWLIDNGFIDIVITTNFDQLLEQALSQRGITPVVISSVSDAKGAAPLAHQDALIFKVNGDYKEVNIKNITEELESYEPAIEDLLDQIFEEYGLIVCGWSGDWDIALREAVLSCESRRYSMYWAYHGELEESAESLIAHRDGIPIQISGASDFFSELKESIRALEGAESGAPLTRQVARERVKRYMSKEDRKIDLTDLLRDETNIALKQLTDEDRFPLDIAVNDDNLDDRIGEYENLVGTLAVATTACAYWGPEVVNPGTTPVRETVRRLGSLNSPNNRYKKLWRDFRMYPATYLTYGMGVTAVESDNWRLINKLLCETQIDTADYPKQRAGFVLNPWIVGSSLSRRGKGNKLLRNRMKNGLREPLREFLPDGDRYEDRFRRFEVLADLVLIDSIDEKSGIGDDLFIRTLYWNEAIEELQSELEAEGENWMPLQVGMFDNSVDRAEFLLENLERIQSRW